MDFNYVRKQLKIAKDGFDLCPGTSQNNKIWIFYVQSWTRQRTKYQNMDKIMSGHKSKSQKMAIMSDG